MHITVVGAGLAGCEAAWRIANSGIKATLIEQKPGIMSDAHKSPLFAELVCSNSLKAERIATAAGMLKEEMRRLNSLCIEAAYTCKVPAGGALAVDRDKFSQYITDKIRAHKNIEIIEREQTDIPEGVCIIATGPLTSDKMAEGIKTLLGEEYLSFYDAAAPIVTAESIDMEKAFFASRYDRGVGDDYINCPFDKQQYEAFIDALLSAERATISDLDKRGVYEGCMPIEVLASRGHDAPRFGPMKPVGLVNPATGHRPWANVQLRRENSEGTLYNIVGFQTNLKFGEQKRVFSLIPGLENAEFVRYGVMHRNTFLNSPKLLGCDLSLKRLPRLFFAGQITGVEGYMESAGSGIIAGINAVRSLQGKSSVIFPADTMLGALMRHVGRSESKNFQPMGANLGILPPLCYTVKDKRERYAAITERGLCSFDRYAADNGVNADLNL